VGDPNWKRHSAKPTLNYIGGKARGIREIVKHFPPQKDEMVAPFIGGGAIEIYQAKRGVRVHGYDLDVGVANYWRCLLKDPVRLFAELRKLWPVTEGDFKLYRTELLSIPNSFRRAALYYVVNRSGFSGDTYKGGYRGEGKTGLKRRHLHAVRAFKLSHLTVDHGDFRFALQQHPNTFAYLDPPYLMPLDYGGYYGPGGILHTNFDHQGLRDLVADRPQWIMSNQDNQMVRDLYAGFEMATPVWSHQCHADSKELLIFSKDLKPQH
jgi:DNA adenine methylase